ncbi:TrkH family potassium uptake protein [bacterium]|nr:TrkH family potassium uptake protein [bacterium]
MRFNYLLSAVGLILILIGFLMVLPIGVALFYGELSQIHAFTIPALSAMLCGIIFRFIADKIDKIENFNDIKKSEGLFIVVLTWCIMGAISSIPFMLMGLNPIDSIFEAASGITTTGATTLTQFDYSHAFFFWRAFIQWIGGMGIIVLFIAILPQFAVAGRQMFFAETPGPSDEKFTPRIRNTASALWKIYLAFTMLEMILLIFAGMPPFDAVCNSFSTLAAAGFSPNPESTMGYNSNLITAIMLVFIFIAGVSFNAQYLALSKFKPWNIFKSEEVRVYTGLFLGIGTVLAITLIYNADYTNIKEAFLHGYYQTISIMTSTGSTSANYNSWSIPAQIVLSVAMFTGGCASSAGGGLKIARWCLVYKVMKTELKKILHPNAVMNIKMDGNIVPKEILTQIIIYVLFYFMIIILSGILVSALEDNLLVGYASSVAAVGNIGPSFPAEIGALGSYDTLHPVSKLILIIDMYVGRLEIIPFLVMLNPDFWIFKKS